MVRFIFAVLIIVQLSMAFAGELNLIGQPLHEVLAQARHDGVDLVYSSELVPESLRVTLEPRGDDPLLRLREILEPHGLALSEVDRVYFVVRLGPQTSAPPKTATEQALADLEIDLIELEQLSISASRYVLFSNSQFFIDQRAIQALPDLGEDPVRSAHRLPGAAANGLSSRSHFRGGEPNETAIYLNGMKLLDPFHIRDYHSIFSAIDARAISGVEAYTGGFPADYGDHMSGVLLFDTRRSEEPLHTELGLSVYNTSLLNSGFTSDDRIDWLFSARDSNLDVVLSEDLGKPDYFDVFGEFGFNFGNGHRLSLNALYSDDQVVVVTENDPAELEQSVSDTRNEHVWVTLENQWTPWLASTSVLSYSGLDNRRDAEVNDPERLIGRVQDSREARILGFGQTWQFSGFDDHAIHAGFEFRSEKARYDYRSSAEYREFYEAWPGITNPAESHIAARPEGNSYALFLKDRWQVTDKTAIELGLRWDKQDYTSPSFDSQVNPRISLLHSLRPSTELRLTWGRYSQSQAIHELQVEDGQDRFFQPQRADHWIAGFLHRFAGHYRFRAEAYYKDYTRLKLRFENLYDPLALIPELSPDRVRLDPGSASARGIEVTLEYRGPAGLDWWVSYSLSRASDTIAGSTQARSWDQRHALQAAMAWRPGKWEIGAVINVHSGWPATGMTLGQNPAPDGEDGFEYYPIPGPRNAEQYGTFLQLDFRVSREISVRRGRLSAFFEVSNLTNRKNECCIDYDLDEDSAGNVFLDRTIDHWLPLLPAVGLLWEF